MKILVCISHVPDTTTKIQFDSAGQELNKTGVTFVINPYCEYGLSRAIGFREEGKQVSITVLCVGGPEVEPTLRKALAIGADDAVRIDAVPSDSGSVAGLIAEYAREREFSIIFTGKESLDFNGSMVPGMLAEHLGTAYVPAAIKMELKDEDSAVVHREIEGGKEIMNVTFPVVISCQKGIAEWRIPNMRGIMAARKKPLSVVKPAAVPAFVESTGFAYPPTKSECEYIDPDNVDRLVSSLANKGFI
ncbi:MAG: electron transfer flavoprotein subunit beta/FixA family protein [Bacteroidota bacterium]